jgi:hypothetical protein
MSTALALADGVTTPISVTAEHIAAGTARNCEKCPIALAILAVIPGIERAAVETDSVTAYGGGAFWHTALMPGEGADFMDLFDAGRPVQPFTLELTWRAW